MRPGLQRRKTSGIDAVERRTSRPFADPLAVGRIGDQAAVLPLAAQVGEIAAAGSGCRPPRRPARRGSRASFSASSSMSVPMIRSARFGRARSRASSRASSQSRPGRRPRLGGELAVQARRHVPADQRRLDRDRARAAKRIDQRPVGPPESSAAPSRRPASPSAAPRRPAPIAALVQAGPVVSIVSVAWSFSRATSIVNVRPGLGSASTPWAAWSFSTIAFLTIFWQAGTLESCDLIDRPLTGKAAVGRNPLFPRQGVGPVEQLAEIGRLERAQPQQHPIGRPQPQIGPADRPLLALKQHPARLDNVRLVAQSSNSRATTASRPKVEVAITSNSAMLCPQDAKNVVVHYRRPRGVGRRGHAELCGVGNYVELLALDKGATALDSVAPAHRDAALHLDETQLAGGRRSALDDIYGESCADCHR